MDQLTSVQISEWEAYNVLDPIGTWRDDYRFARLEALMQNLVLSLYHTKGTPEPKYAMPIDQMPDWAGDKHQEEPETQSWQDMKAIFSGIARDQNKKVALEKVIPPPPKKYRK